MELHKKRKLVDRNIHILEFKRVTKEIRKRYNQLRNKFYENQAQKLNDAHQARELDKLFRYSKNQSVIKVKTETVKCPGLENHFKTHFTHEVTKETPEKLITIPEFIQKLKCTGYHIDKNAASPEIHKITSAIKKLKRSKASTDIPSEYLKTAAKSKKNLIKLKDVLADLWKQGNKSIPEYCINRKLAAIYKKGSKTDPSNYRAEVWSLVVCNKNYSYKDFFATIK